VAFGQILIDACLPKEANVSQVVRTTVEAVIA
jgi:hypothetical protein